MLEGVCAGAGEEAVTDVHPDDGGPPAAEGVGEGGLPAADSDGDDREAVGDGSPASVARDAVVAAATAGMKAKYGECVVSSRRDFAVLQLRKTRYRQVKVKLLFPQTYDGLAMSVELSSPTLTNQLLRRLQAKANKASAASPPEEQAVAALDTLHTAIHDNKLLYAWPEIRQCKSLVDAVGGTMKVNEGLGTVRVAAGKGAYSCSFLLTVPDAYPDSTPDLTMKKTTYHDELLRPYVAQAQEIIRRCGMGYPAHVAVRASNPIKPPPDIAKVDVLKDARITKDHVKNLKHDVAFLKQATDLREFNDRRRAGNNKAFAEGTKERRAARRTLKKLTAEEEAAEARQLEALQARAAAEAAGAAGAGFVAEESDPTPCVFAVVEFLVEELVGKLSSEHCLLCSSSLLPADPKRVDRIMGKEDHPKHPERLFCGHWYHFKCLDTHLTTPPFEKMCLACGRRMFHPKWSADVAKLEKRWAVEQAHKRELSDITDLLDLGDEFAI